MTHRRASDRSSQTCLERYHSFMATLKRPGASLLVVGLILFFLVRPIIGKVWLVGGILAPMSFVVGLLAIVGGGYLVFRSQFGSNR